MIRTSRLSRETTKHTNRDLEMPMPTSLKHIRSSAWTTYKTARSAFGRKTAFTRSQLQAFLKVNKQLRNFAIRSQIEYEKSLLLRMKESPKLIYSYLRHKKTFCSSLGPLRLASGSITDDPRTMADSFTEALASTFVTATPPDPFPHQHCDTEPSSITFCLQDIENVLSHLDTSSAMGPDGLHPHLLKACALKLAYPLYKVFQLSLPEGALPSIWKLSHVVPIFKKGSRSEP